MAEFRAVYTKVWRDNWFSLLDPPRKVVWMYLITNPSASVAGIYQLPVRFIAFDTGLPESTVHTILEEFKTADKIDFEDDNIWVKKLRDYQETSSLSVAIRIRKDLALIPPGRLKDVYCKKYTLSTPCEHPIYEKDKDREGEGERETKEPPAPTAPPPTSQFRTSAETKPELLVVGLPHGTELQAALDKHFGSKQKSRPAWKSLASFAQADAYRAAANALEGEFMDLVVKGLGRERDSRSALLAWLETCVKNKMNNKRNGHEPPKERQRPMRNFNLPS